MSALPVNERKWLIKVDTMPYVGKDKVANILLIILFRRTLTQNTLFPDLTYGEQNVRLSAELKPAYGGQ